MDPTFKEAIIKTAEDTIPIHKFLGLKVLEIKKDHAKVEVPFKEEFIGDLRRNRWHGGILSLIMDSVGGMIGIANFTSFEDKLSTIDLRVDFLKGAEAGNIIVEGELVRLGNRIMVTRMTTYQNDQVIAEGKGVYNFIKMKTKKD